MSPDDPEVPVGLGPTLGPLLVRLRLARGVSQLRVAEQLCAASGVPTVTRHEVSRWEREERVPGDFWLAWLAMVLATPVEQLSAAAAATRARYTGAAQPRRGDHEALGRLAHAWLTEPVSPPTGAREDVRRLADRLAAVGRWLARWGGGPEPAGADPGRLDLAGLRRLDDLVGGADLAGAAGRLLVATARRLAAPARLRPADALVQIADAAQFAGWVAADAGDRSTALAGYRLALLAATAAGDRPLGAYALSCASHLLVDAGEPAAALLLARTAYAGGYRIASATTRAVLLHRVALAAATTGQRAVAERALGGADRAAGRREPSRDPAWLYWAGEPQLRAMAGRCLVALGRPLRAEPLLRTGPSAAAGPREAALAAAVLARTYVDLGEVERACDTARAALLDAIRSGSVRAGVRVTGVTGRLGRFADLAPARDHLRLAGAATPYLPTVGPAGGSGRAAGQHTRELDVPSRIHRRAARHRPHPQ